MTDAARSWPKQFENLLANLEAGEHAGSYRADVEVSDAELTELNLFEAAARHQKVVLPLPTGPAAGAMDVVIGLGAPRDPSRHAARVRISFSEVAPLA